MGLFLHLIAFCALRFIFILLREGFYGAANRDPCSIDSKRMAGDNSKRGGGVDREDVVFVGMV